MSLRILSIVTVAVAAWTGAALAQVSDGVVKLAVLNDQSGLYADVTGQGSVVAARMAVEDFGGRVLDAPIEVIFADHQNKADIAAATANRWFDVEQVDVILDNPNSSAMLAVNEIARRKQRLFLVSGGGASSLTNEHCSPYTFHWLYDTYALAKVTGLAAVKSGLETWFMLTVDYAYGAALEKDLTQFVREAGGTVVGGVKHPISTADFSSFLLQAQASGADVIGLNNAGGDLINSIKQANEFGIVDAGQNLAGLLVFINDVHSLGLAVANGLVLTTGFYWDHDAETRAWSRRFFDRHGAMPSMIHASVYSSVTHYLEAVAAAGTDDADTVAAGMRAAPVDDFFGKGGTIRADGRMVHEMYLMEIKKPSESEEPWDYYKLRAVIPGDDAFRPLSESVCPLVD